MERLDLTEPLASLGSAVRLALAERVSAAIQDTAVKMAQHPVQDSLDRAASQVSVLRAVILVRAEHQAQAVLLDRMERLALMALRVSAVSQERQVSLAVLESAEHQAQAVCLVLLGQAAILV
jgi:vacuolar-type H+-ATPase subunit H